MTRHDREATGGGVYDAVTEMLDDNLRREVLRNRHQSGRRGRRGAPGRGRTAEGRPLIPNHLHHLVVQYRLGPADKPPHWRKMPIVAWKGDGEPLVVGHRALVPASSITEVDGLPVLSWRIDEDDASCWT
jgi:hypothetical protein